MDITSLAWRWAGKSIPSLVEDRLNFLKLGSVSVGLSGNVLNFWGLMCVLACRLYVNFHLFCVCVDDMWGWSLEKGANFSWRTKNLVEKAVWCKPFVNLVYTLTSPMDPSTWHGDLWFKVVLPYVGWHRHTLTLSKTFTTYNVIGRWSFRPASTSWNCQFTLEL